MIGDEMKFMNAVMCVLFLLLLLTEIGCAHSKRIMKNCEKAQSDFYICDEAN